MRQEIIVEQHRRHLDLLRDLRCYHLFQLLQPDSQLLHCLLLLVGHIGSDITMCNFWIKKSKTTFEFNFKRNYEFIRSCRKFYNLLGLPHTLIEHSYRQFTVCKVCDHLLVGLMKQGLKCRDCGVNVHRKCAMELASNCVLAENAISRVNFADSEAEAASSSDNIPLFRLPGKKILNNQAAVPRLHFLRTLPKCTVLY